MMREAILDIWDLPEDTWKAITTNGSIKNNSECVMERGNALQAKQKYPNIAYRLGSAIKQYGNIPYAFPDLHIISFPVKHVWWEKADIALIEKSAKLLLEILDELGIEEVYLPRPGVLNGRLKWENVKKALEPVLDDRVIVVTNEKRKELVL